MTHDELLVALDEAKSKAAEVNERAMALLRESNEADRKAEELELTILRMEGREGTPRGAWLQARLANDNDAVDIALAAMYPESQDARDNAERAEKRIQRRALHSEAMEAQP